MSEFAKMPSYRIRDNGAPVLSELKWSQKDNAAKIAALMLYIAICHNAKDKTEHVYEETGTCRLSYDRLALITGLSRPIISKGLSILEKLRLIEADRETKPTLYRVVGYNPHKYWAKLPKRYLYNKEGSIPVFHEFHLRKKNELGALKMYLLIASFRDNKTGLTRIAYDKIADYTGMQSPDIKQAISLLLNHNLISLERQTYDEVGKRRNIYTLKGLGHRHFGNADEIAVKAYTKDDDID